MRPEQEIISKSQSNTQRNRRGRNSFSPIRRYGQDRVYKSGYTRCCKFGTNEFSLLDVSIRKMVFPSNNSVTSDSEGKCLIPVPDDFVSLIAIKSSN